MGLLVKDLHVMIQSVEILRQVTLDVPTNAMVGLIGRNGAGKTTLIRSVMGMLRISSGSIEFDDIDLVSLPSHRRSHFGIGYLPEDRRLVPQLTATDNVLLPSWIKRLGDDTDRLNWIYKLLPEVKELGQRRAIQLSGGQQKLVALARALMAGRSLLLLDEPFEGGAPGLARRLAEVLAELKKEGITILLSESDDTHSSNLVDDSYVIERGQIRLN